MIAAPPARGGAGRGVPPAAAAGVGVAGAAAGRGPRRGAPGARRGRARPGGAGGQRGAGLAAKATVNPKRDPSNPLTVPMVGLEEGQTPMDVYKFLLMNRVVFVRGYLDDLQTTRVVGSLLALQALDPAEPITLYVNSPGGMFYNVAGVLDTMATLSNPISTVVVGSAMNMSALIACAGTKGKRFAMPNSRLMFKQPQGGAQGSNVEVNITTTELSRNLMATIEWLIKYTGKGRTEIEELLDRDTFMSSVEAVAAGYLDGIIDGEAPMQEQVLAQKAAFYKKTRPLRYTEDDEELLSPVPGYALPAGIEFRAVNEFAEAEPAAEPAAVAVEAEPAAEPDTA